VVGRVKYKGFFVRSDALKEIERLEEKGLDTCLQGAVAYSTLGWLGDPVYSTMAELGQIMLIATVIHELVHTTIFIKDYTEFNEQLATFVAEKGTMLFVDEYYGSNSSESHEARDVFHDEAVVAMFIEDIYQRLQRLYRQDFSVWEKLGRRRQIFEWATNTVPEVMARLRTETVSDLTAIEWNNAVVLAWRRYHNPPDGVLSRVYRSAGNDLAVFLSVMQEIPHGIDPWDYLEDWLQQGVSRGG
jgi:predicted aminopeptidase